MNLANESLGVWVREGEKTMSARVTEGLKDFNTAGQLQAADVRMVVSCLMVILDGVEWKGDVHKPALLRARHGLDE